MKYDVNNASQVLISFKNLYLSDIPRWSSEQCQISSPQHPTLTEILSTLEPFKEIFELLKTDQLLISVAIPSILSLIKLLEQKPRTSFTRMLLEQLRAYHDNIINKPLFTTAAFLDPRLVHFKLFDDDRLSVSCYSRSLAPQHQTMLNFLDLHILYIAKELKCFVIYILINDLTILSADLKSPGVRTRTRSSG